jgi:hypothetical protein
VAYAVLGLCLIVGLGLMGRWLLNAKPRDILRAAKWGGGIAVAGLTLFVLLRGDLRWLAYVAPLALPFLLRGTAIWRTVRNAAKARRGPTPGQRTGVRTRWLAMTLDHDTGAMDGEILQGPYAGRMLSDLSSQELATLAEALDDDRESRQVFDAWLERAGPHAAAGSSEETDSRAAGDDSVMTPARAREILGVGEEAGEKEIRDAHRRLMLANHPDRGGSSWLAAQINLAKDVLLRQG